MLMPWNSVVFIDVVDDVASALSKVLVAVVFLICFVMAKFADDADSARMRVGFSVIRFGSVFGV